MATKSGANASGEKVTRISAKSDAPKVTKKPQKTVSKSPSKTVTVKEGPTNPIVKLLFAIGGYFRGAWIELRLVRWPTRRATWGLTIAVLLFSAFFVLVIVLLDIFFKYIFELILK